MAEAHGNRLRYRQGRRRLRATGYAPLLVGRFSNPAGNWKRPVGEILLIVICVLIAFWIED
jgi:hypothetical protein